MRWTRKSIIAEINRLHESGEQLNYSAAEGNHLNLVRAAAWHYGTWRHAVESAGVNYESLSRYQRWSKARIVERINELHKQEQDLSWRAVSTEVDPPLAAAALRVNGFKSWREALAAAGIDVDNTARYKYWDEAKVIKAIRARKRAGEPMSSKSLQKSDQCLFCAARRRFGSWDSALAAAGLNVDKIRLRRHNSLLNAPRAKKENGLVAAPASAAKPAAGKAVAAKASAKPTASKAAKAAAQQLTLDIPAAKLATKAPAKAAAKKAAVSPNGKAAAPVKLATKATPVKVTPAKPTEAKKAAVKAAPAKAPAKATPAKTVATKAPAATKASAKTPAVKTPAKAPAKAAATKAPAASKAPAKAPAKVPAKAAAKAPAKAATKAPAKAAAKAPAKTAAKAPAKAPAKTAAKKAPAKRAAR